MSGLKKNFIYNTTYQLLNLLLPLITTPYISRTLGAERIGTFSYSNAISYYFTMFIILGLNNYGNRTIAQVQNNKSRLSQTFFEIYGMQFFVGICVTIAYMLYCTFVSKNLISWILLINILSSLIDINWFFFGLEKFKITVSRSMVIKVISTLLIFILVKGSGDLAVYVVILCSATFCSNAILWAFLKKEIIFSFERKINIWKHLIPNLVLFVPIVAVSLYKYMDKIMLGILSDMSQVGFYEYSEKILQIPMALVNSLAVIMLPRMSNLVANSRDNEANKYIELSIDVSMFLTSSLCFGLMGVSKQFVPIFYGNGYEPCVKLFYALLPSCCFVAFASVIRTQHLIPRKKDKVYIVSVCLGAFVNVIFNLLFIPRFNALGAAFGTLVAEFVVCVYQCFIVRNELTIKNYFFNSLPFLISGLMMFLVLIIIPECSINYITIAYKVIVGIGVYFLFLISITRLFFKNRYGVLKSYGRDFLGIFRIKR